MSAKSKSPQIRRSFFAGTRRAVVLGVIVAIATKAEAADVRTAYQTAFEGFLAAARAEGLDLALGPPQCLDFSNLTAPSKAKGDLPLYSCRVDLPCARLTLAGSVSTPQTFALAGHIDPTTCQEARWSGYQHAFASAYLRCDNENGRTAALVTLADRPVRLDDPKQPAPSDPRIEARPEAIAFQAACGAMTGIRRVQTAPGGRNDDIVFKSTITP